MNSLILSFVFPCILFILLANHYLCHPLSDLSEEAAKILEIEDISRPTSSEKRLAKKVAFERKEANEQRERAKGAEDAKVS